MLTMMITDGILTSNNSGFVISKGIDIGYFIICRVFGLDNIDTDSI